MISIIQYSKNFQSVQSLVAELGHHTHYQETDQGYVEEF